MSTYVHNKPVLHLSVFSGWKMFTSVKEYFQQLSGPYKVLFLGIGTSVALTIFSSRFFRRRKVYKKSALSSSLASRRHKPVVIRLPSYDDCDRSSNSPGLKRLHLRHNSVGSDKVANIATPNVINRITEEEAETLSPQQFGAMGMESLDRAIGLWEEALCTYKGSDPHGVALPSHDVVEFTTCLQKVVDSAYELQDQCEQLFLHENSILFRSAQNSPTCSISNYNYRSIRSSSIDSFVSAQDIGDLRNFEEFDENPPSLYLNALKHHEEHGIAYREIRTERVGCASDTEYICKIHCLRLCSTEILSQQLNRDWFENAGRNVIDLIFSKADKDPKDALASYDEFLLYLQDCDWDEISVELKSRGVPCVTFYDVVLDFILIDSFEDLENPPSSVYAIMQNRWLSNGFKESALSTAVWSVIKAKRRLLLTQDGFISHFYGLTQHLSPVLAWGFLGPDRRFSDFCFSFKSQIENMLSDMFDFSCVRYTNVKEMSVDLLLLAHRCYDVIMQSANHVRMIDSPSKSNGVCHIGDRLMYEGD